MVSAETLLYWFLRLFILELTRVSESQETHSKTNRQTEKYNACKWSLSMSQTFLNTYKQNKSKWIKYCGFVLQNLSWYKWLQLLSYKTAIISPVTPCLTLGYCSLKFYDDYNARHSYWLFCFRKLSSAFITPPKITWSFISQSIPSLFYPPNCMYQTFLLFLNHVLLIFSFLFLFQVSWSRFCVTHIHISGWFEKTIYEWAPK